MLLYIIYYIRCVLYIILLVTCIARAHTRKRGANGCTCIAFQSTSLGSSSDPCSESLSEPLPDRSANSEGEVLEGRLLPLSEPGGIGAGAFFA